MRYYFHLNDGDKLSRDPVGLNTTRDDAWKLALRLIAKTRRNHPGLGSTAHVYLADETGTAYLIPIELADAAADTRSLKRVAA